jgi:hypothetical protein
VLNVLGEAPFFIARRSSCSSSCRNRAESADSSRSWRLGAVRRCGRPGLKVGTTGF